MPSSTDSKTPSTPEKMQHGASDIMLDWILQMIEDHLAEGKILENYIIGVSGIQGIGKSTAVNKVAAALRQHPHNLKVIVMSIDDFYLTNAEQKDHAQKHPDNPLVQHRGQPSTHNWPLVLHTLKNLYRGIDCVVPVYDKSLHNGEGDRLPIEDCFEVPGDQRYNIILFEGWCVGFEPLPEHILSRKWTQARQWALQPGSGRYEYPGYYTRLGLRKFEDIQYINNALALYAHIWDLFDCLIFLEPENIRHVYPWRMQQEKHLREVKGTGMTDRQVFEFINNYYPSYELYLDGLQYGMFSMNHPIKGHRGQLTLTLDKKRNIIKQRLLGLHPLARHSELESLSDVLPQPTLRIPIDEHTTLRIENGELNPVPAFGFKEPKTEIKLDPARIVDSAVPFFRTVPEEFMESLMEDKDFFSVGPRPRSEDT